MTVQEKAIEQLERVNKHLATIGEKEDYTGAIQALEQCDDAVSKQAVLDIVRFEENWLSDAKSNNADTDIAFSGIRAQVAKLSPVTKALEPCDDAVGRKALLDKAWDVPYDGKYIQVVDVGDIEELPSVTPARKKGEWCKQNDDYNDWYECSECGYGSEGEMQYSSEYDVRTNYCPHCGCKMESRESNLW